MEYLDISFSFTIYKFLKLKHSSTTYSDLKIIRNPCQCVYVIESRIAIRIACESFKLNTRTEGQGLFFWCFWLSLHMVHSTGRIKRVQVNVYPLSQLPLHVHNWSCYYQFGYSLSFLEIRMFPASDAAKTRFWKYNK